jgi:hypothetical protein
MTIPAGEPKDGDFVAYLADIERRQLLSMSAPHRLEPPSAGSSRRLTGWEAAALKERLRGRKASALGFFGPLLLALVGLVVLLTGLKDGGIVPTLLGVFLLWRAAVGLRRSLKAGSATGA